MARPTDVGVRARPRSGVLSPSAKKRLYFGYLHRRPAIVAQAPRPAAQGGSCRPRRDLMNACPHVEDCPMKACPQVRDCPLQNLLPASLQVFLLM